MKSVSRSIGLQPTINPQILQYVLGQITFLHTGKNKKMAAEVDK